MKMLLIYNPHAGKSQIKNYLWEILDIFTKNGYLVTTYPTQAQSDAYEKIKSLGAEYDIIVVSGGDGTLNEGVRGMMELPKRDTHIFGYIPAGTVNDFASSLGIPKHMPDAARNIINGSPFACDVGKFQEKYFSYVAAFGAFTEVSYETSQEQKNILGHLAYVLQGIKKLSSLTDYSLTIEYDEKLIEGKFIFGMISNSYSVAGIKCNDNLKVSLNDGQFEALFIKVPENLMDLQAAVTDLLRQNFQSPYFVTLRAKKIAIVSDEKVAWTIDGEYGGEYLKTEIEVCPKQLNILV